MTCAETTPTSVKFVRETLIDLTQVCEAWFEEELGEVSGGRTDARRSLVQ